MAKSIAKKAKKEQVNTEDRVMEGVVTIAAWAEHNRRLVTLGVIALIAITFAGWAYVDYLGKMNERAVVRLDEIRMTAASGAPVAQTQGELADFISQFGGTPFAGEARLYLAQLQLQSQQFDAAIQTLEPAADLRNETPVAFRAASSIAAAEELAGRPDRSIQWLERIADAAIFDFQRTEALSEQARIYAQEGRFDRAEELYRRLLEDQEPAADDQASIWAVRLGEIEALQSSGGSYPSPPAAASAAPAAAPGVALDETPSDPTPDDG